jgi:murein DD-endopeptidase MepM/ murein hydrolase activator NlpD
VFYAALSICLLSAGCVQPAPNSRPWTLETTPTAGTAPATFSETAQPTSNALVPTQRQPGSPVLTPTPDEPHTLPTPRSNEERYIVQRGDTLGIIAQRFGVKIDAILAANEIPNPDLVEVGVELVIPAPKELITGPDFKILPDSELVAGPASAYFDLEAFVQSTRGYLKIYREEINAETLTGAEVVARVSSEYSVNPRLLLALLQHEAGWLTMSDPDTSSREFPLGNVRPAYKNLYRQLAWAANNLNRGYYLWKAGGISTWILADGSLIAPAATINAGTAGVQHFYSLLYGQADWEKAVGAAGLFATYEELFGFPFDFSVEPLLPADLAQPEMQLPFEDGAVWSFTGGPHGGWGTGSGWAAIDFAPPGEALGCVQSDAWVTAVAPGRILYARNGAVIQELDTDGLFQTGWTVLYMHIETRGRIEALTPVQPGDRIGHPSCEGGVSNGTHVHLARRYNGEWIPADGSLPFNLDGWISSGNGIEYDGWLVRADQTKEAWDGRVDVNQMWR